MINLLNKFSAFKALDKLELDNKKLLLIAIFCFVGIYLDFTLFLKIQCQTLKNLEPKIIKLKKDLDTLSKDLNTMQNLKNDPSKANQKMSGRGQKILSETDISSLFQDISNMANKHKVEILQMKPSRESPALKQEKTLATEKLTLLFINLDLICDYHSLGKFINDLENAPIFINVANLKIASSQQDYLKQNVALVLRTYVRK